MEPPNAQLRTMTNATEIIIDLEATGLARTSHILHISAINGENHFNQILVHPKVREITGIRTEDKKMYHNDKELKAVNITTGLTSCLDFFV